MQFRSSEGRGGFRGGYAMAPNTSPDMVCSCSTPVCMGLPCAHVLAATTFFKHFKCQVLPQEYLSSLECSSLVTSNWNISVPVAQGICFSWGLFKPSQNSLSEGTVGGIRGDSMIFDSYYGNLESEYNVAEIRDNEYPNTSSEKRTVTPHSNRVIYNSLHLPSRL